MKRTHLLALVTLATTFPFLPLLADSPPVATMPALSSPPATQPKALSDNVTSALKWLISHQSSDGGWAQGEESAAMGNGMEALKDKSNVGDSCIAILALLRSGSTPSTGDYAGNIRRGIDFVCKEVMTAPADGLTITSINGTRIQTKLGPNIDTFLASLMLGEIRNKMPDDASKKSVIAALDKVLDKIEKNVKEDGSIAQGGWAGGIAQGMAVRGVNVAVSNGATVDEATLRKFETNAQQRQNADGSTKLGTDVAGVQLYATASNVTALENNNMRLEQKAGELQAAMNAPTTSPADRDRLASEYKDVKDRFDNNDKQLKAAAENLAKQAQDDRFIAGFGSNGGEEFLSYLNLGETLFKKGGEDWSKWDAKMTANLNNVQNKDGSWSGQHCITGRTFCTSAALMVLMIDREDHQVAMEMRRR